MKKYSKILAVALAVLMLMMTSITAFADHAYLQLGETETISQVGGEYDTFNFSSEDGGWFLIHTATDDDITDPYINIYYYDETDEQIYVASADDSIYGCYDSELCFYAEPGEVYYIDFGNYNSDLGYAEYEVCIEEWEEGLHYYHYDYDWDAVCDECGYDYCDHKCHDNGFFWRIANFFNRLFRINEVCECGNYHW